MIDRIYARRRAEREAKAMAVRARLKETAALESDRPIQWIGG
jgi:hypothetical protein